MNQQTADTTISFQAKWLCKVINATYNGLVWSYVIPDYFIPINEVPKPYMLDHLTDADAVKVLQGSVACNLISSYTGFNLDLSLLAVMPGEYSKRFFLTDAQKLDTEISTTTNVVEGDSLLILVPQD